MRIIIKNEEGPQLMYLALIGYFSLYPKSWGKISNTFLTKKAQKYFRKKGLDNTIKEFFDFCFMHFNNYVGEATLVYFALLYKNPQREEPLLNYIKKSKPKILPFFDEIKENYLLALNSFKKSIKNSNLEKQTKEATKKDILKKRSLLPRIKTLIKKDFLFFNTLNYIDNQTFIITPTNFFPYQFDAGSYFFENEVIIIDSEPLNLGLIEHEVLHSLMTPLAEEFLEQNSYFAPIIVELSCTKRKMTYGNNPTSLLGEELIYTYTDHFKKKLAPTYQNFLQEHSFKNEKYFQQFFVRHSGFKHRCCKLNINKLQTFKKKSKEYFNIYEKNKLSETIYQLYFQFQSAKKNKKQVNFRDFFLSNFNKYLKIKTG